MTPITTYRHIYTHTATIIIPLLPPHKSASQPFNALPLQHFFFSFATKTVQVSPYFTIFPHSLPVMRRRESRRKEKTVGRAMAMIRSTPRKTNNIWYPTERDKQDGEKERETPTPTDCPVTTVSSLRHTGTSSQWLFHSPPRYLPLYLLFSPLHSLLSFIST